MFGFLKQRRIARYCANQIGRQLHGQISRAYDNSESITGERLTSAFVAGYLYGFIRFGFVMNGIPGDKVIDKHLKHICNGVIPGRLYEVFKRNLSALQIEKELGENKKGKEFEKGIEVGFYDAGIFSPYEDVDGDNLYKYLVCEEVAYTPMKRDEKMEVSNQRYIDSLELDEDQLISY